MNATKLPDHLCSTGSFGRSVSGPLARTGGNFKGRNTSAPKLWMATLALLCIAASQGAVPEATVAPKAEPLAITHGP